METEYGQLPNPTINIGYVKIAFCWAFYYLKCKYPFEIALTDILSRGGDTDTNACIVGGLLGARDGVSNLNRKWVKAMINARCDESKKHDGQIRPNFLIPNLFLVKNLYRTFYSAPKDLNVKITGVNLKTLEGLEDFLKNVKNVDMSYVKY